MATTTNTPCSGAAGGSTASTQATATTAGPCCTGLECFEKPRFFCGQLLTDLDLDAAMNYIAAKNRLHNRYLFGAGVVCGLGVRCDPCDPGSIVIDSGYALDCLGNDIVVCAPKPFSVAKYLDCRNKQQSGCGGSKPIVPKGCETPETEYCLVISYDEKPAKPVSALIRDNGCRVSRCEPSRTLEVFKLDLIDHDTAKKLNVQPSLWSQISTCIKAEGQKIVSFLNEFSALDTKNTQEWLGGVESIVARLKQAILDYSKRVNPVHCKLVDELCAIDKNFRLAYQSVNYDPKLNQSAKLKTAAAAPYKALIDYFLLYVQLLIDCVCNSFMVPCNDCCEPEYVLLACLKVRDGEVVSICNTVRTQVITGPSVRYWLQPLFTAIGNIMEYLCCTLDLTKYVDEQTSFTGLNMKYGQAFNMQNMVKTYSSAMMMNLKTKLTKVPPPPPADQPPPQSSSFNFYQQPIDQVQKDLEASGVNVTVKRAATVEEAYSLFNLPRQTLTLDRGAKVELLVGPDNKVTSIRNV